jgi:hypothetical protein
MKLRFEYAIFYSTVIFGAITCLNGCANIGMERATKNTDTMQIVETGMAQAKMKTGCASDCGLKSRSGEKTDNETETARKY